MANTRIVPNSVGGYTGATVNTSDTTITLSSSTGWPTTSAGQQYSIKIGSEYCLVIGRTGAVLTVTRATQGTTATSYPAGTLVFICLTGDDLLNINTNTIVAAAASGTPVDSPLTGTIRFDSSSNKLWCYNGSAWKSTTLV